MKLLFLNPAIPMPRKLHQTLLIKALLLCSISLSSLFAVAYSGMLWVNCNSITFGYFLIPKYSYQNWTLSSIKGLIPVTIITFWFVIDFAGNFVFFVIDLSLVQAYCLLRYVEYINLSVENGKSSSEFVGIYRQLQILSRYYNLFQQDALMTSTLFFVLMGVIIASFLIISPGAKLAFPDLMLFSVGMHDLMLILLVYTSIMGFLHSSSRKLVCRAKKLIWIKNDGVKQEKIAQSQFKSTWSIKVFIGYSNYVEELTPLNLFNFAFNRFSVLLNVLI